MRLGVEFVTTGDITERANVISFNVLSLSFLLQFIRIFMLGCRDGQWSFKNKSIKFHY